MVKYGAFWNGIDYSIIKVKISRKEITDVEVLLCSKDNEASWVDWSSWVYEDEELGELYNTLEEAVTPDVMEFLIKNSAQYTCGSIKGFPFTKSLTV